MKRLAYIAAGLLAGILASMTIPAMAAWLVSSSGEASVQLATLEPLKVGAASVNGDKALPGKKLALVASYLENDNGVTVQVLDTTLVGLESEDADCKASLGSGVKYTARESFDLKDGRTEDVPLGTVSLGSLSNRCQGATLEGTVRIQIGYGS